MFHNFINRYYQDVVQHVVLYKLGELVMRYRHDAVTRARNVLVTRLSFVIKEYVGRQGMTYKSFCETFGVSRHAVYFITKKDYAALSFDHLLTVADRIGLVYSLVITRHSQARTDVQLDLPGYFEDSPLMIPHTKKKQSKPSSQIGIRH